MVYDTPRLYDHVAPCRAGGNEPARLSLDPSKGSRFKRLYAARKAHAFALPDSKLDASLRCLSAATEGHMRATSNAISPTPYDMNIPNIAYPTKLGLMGRHNRRPFLAKKRVARATSASPLGALNGVFRRDRRIASRGLAQPLLHEPGAPREALGPWKSRGLRHLRANSWPRRAIRSLDPLFPSQSYSL